MEGATYFRNINILTKWGLIVFKRLCKLPSWLLCACYLDDRDERAGPHHQHCLPDTRHDRQGRTGPPAGTGELWPGSDAWPTPGIAWMLQSGICGAPKVKIRKISEIQQNILLQLHELGTKRRTRKANLFRCSVYFQPLNRVIMWLLNNKEPTRCWHICCWVSRLHWFWTLQMSMRWCRWEFQSAVKLKHALVFPIWMCFLNKCKHAWW